MDGTKLLRFLPLRALTAILVGAALLIGVACDGEEEVIPTSTPTSIPTPLDQVDEGLFLPEIPRISVGEVKAELDAQSNIVIVDTRSKGSYEDSHIPGAISIPSAEIAQRSDELHGYEEVITYCT